MNLVLGSAGLGAFLIFVGAHQLKRGRGGRMTRDGITFTFMGIAAVFWAISLLINMFVSWLDTFLNNTTAIIISILGIEVSRTWVVLLLVGLTCLVTGLISAAIYYMKHLQRED